MNMSRTVRSHARLLAGIDRCLGLAADPARLDATNPTVSGWSVGLHVEHLLLAAEGILPWIHEALANPEACPAAGKPSPTGSMVLVSGWIPRGRASAPERTVPRTLAVDDLARRLEELRASVERLGAKLPEVHAVASTLEHPLLGHYTPSQWLRFLDVHHRHHEKIMRDIG